MALVSNILGPMPEGASASIAFTFRDSANDLITSLTTCVFNLDDGEGNVINSRSDVDALTDGDFSFSAGVLTWRVKGADAVSSVLGNRITIEATFNNGLGPNEGKINEEFRLRVRDLAQV